MHAASIVYYFNSLAATEYTTARAKTKTKECDCRELPQQSQIGIENLS